MKTHDYNTKKQARLHARKLALAQEYLDNVSWIQSLDQHGLLTPAWLRRYERWQRTLFFRYGRTYQMQRGNPPRGIPVPEIQKSYSSCIAIVAGGAR